MSTRFPASSKEARENVGRAGLAWPASSPPAGRHPFLPPHSTRAARPQARATATDDGWLGFLVGPGRVQADHRRNHTYVVRASPPRHGGGGAGCQ